MYMAKSPSKKLTPEEQESLPPLSEFQFSFVASGSKARVLQALTTADTGGAIRSVLLTMARSLVASRRVGVDEALKAYITASPHGITVTVTSAQVQLPRQVNSLEELELLEAKQSEEPAPKGTTKASAAKAAAASGSAPQE
jgi:hypothetical protein